MIPSIILGGAAITLFVWASNISALSRKGTLIGALGFACMILAIILTPPVRKEVFDDGCVRYASYVEDC